MLTPFIHPGLAEPRTKEEWRAYLDTPPPPRPAMPTFADYRRLSAKTAKTSTNNAWTITARWSSCAPNR